MTASLKGQAQIMLKTEKCPSGPYSVAIYGTAYALSIYFAETLKTMENLKNNNLRASSEEYSFSRNFSVINAM